MRATVLIVAAALNLHTFARADPITYTQQVNANGSLGGISFANALLTFSFSGDTANVTNTTPGFFENILGQATVAVAGIGTATFTDMMGPSSIKIFPLRGSGGLQTASL
jgi:hypothetical protein